MSMSTNIIGVEPTTNVPHMFTGSKNVTCNGGVFQSANHIVNYSGQQPFQRGLDILQHHIAPGAFHNSAERFDPPRCYPNTREAIQAKIEAWVKERPENGDRLVLWMYGPAGVGKSAIAQSIAELCEALLAASFFFSRTTSGRSDSSRLVATIVWQLIMSIPEIRDTVLSSVERDPTILSRTPATQMKCLVVDPLNQVAKEILEQRPRFVIIDGLDECLPPRSQDDILNFLSTSLKRLNTPLYFLIASRPHQNIGNIFMSDSFNGTIQTLPLAYDYDQSQKDIRHFLISSFTKIRMEQPYLSKSWPNSSDLESIVKKSSGQFVYAATVMRYIDSGNHGHESRLSAILALSSSHNTDTPFAALDELYLQIFRAIGKGEIERVMEVLGAHICLNIRALDVLEEFFNYRPGELAHVLRTISALVFVPDKPSLNVTIYHASLPDFLLDRTRSQSFYVDPPKISLALVRRCIQGDQVRPSTAPDKMCYGDPLFRYARIYSECIHKSPNTEDLRNFLLEFNLWDKLPIQVSLLFHNDICTAGMNLLEKFQELCKDSDPGWTQIFEYHLGRIDRWIEQVFSLIPSDFQSPVITAFMIHTKFIIDRTHILLFEEILDSLGVDMEGAFDAVNNHVRIRTADFITFILQRISIIFGPEYEPIQPDFLSFSYFCAMAGSMRDKPVVVAEMEMSAFTIYLAAALHHCEESRPIFDVLKGDNLKRLASAQKRMISGIWASVFESDHPIDADFSHYMERCERVFKVHAEEDAATAPPMTDAMTAIERIHSSFKLKSRTQVD
ncbi:hypothetical protein M413DRAFT_391183 [Hebeloma cylindrosporum]|uniref:Nephrocystin 3-like N-terminal domain-containing protein n=1 Tax=Hebeloma cylindrosporum TaxID=76867 RepID=A0A0C2Y178_HEBCY|nr:hypothetical protein M413DRAFT_391183 [Hebeloma cylindrosporum h7]